MVDKNLAVAQLWRAGVLHWKLDSAERVLYDDVTKARAACKPRFVMVCSRRWGKTYSMAVMAIEQALRTPNTQIAFISKTKRSAKEISEKIMRQLIADCPRALRPTYHKQDFRWEFVNGSTLFFMGTDAGHYEKARGREFHLIMIDEAGFVDELNTIIAEVLAPTLLTTNGFMLLASTPPKKTSHPFTKIFRQSQADSSFCFKTIYDNPRINEIQIARAKEECGGEDTPTWRREYLCEFIDEDVNTVIPEWTHAKSLELIQDLARPEYCDKYVSLDIGFRDLTVALFAWWDFPNARIVIEDELVLKGKETTTGKIASELSLKLQILWGNPDTWREKGEVFQFSDVDPRLIYELKTLHGLSFQQTQKDNKDAQINQVRLMVGSGQIVVNPKCRTLIQTLFAATWDKNHKTYERSTEIGHADALDALIYLCRNLRKHRNPLPAGQHWTEQHNVDRRPKPLSPAMQTLASVYGNTSASLREQVMRKLGRRRVF